MSKHEFAVGMAVIVEQRFGHEPESSPARSSYETTIVRETSTRWVLGDGRRWIKKGTNVVLPRYIDYATTARTRGLL